MIKKYNLKKVHFCLPGYSSRSNGISILWECAELFSKFIPVTVSVYREGDSIFDGKIKYELYDGKESTLVIYPDEISDNPLNAKNIGRFLLASPYTLNLDFKVPGKNDFLFCYSNLISKKMPQLNYLCETKALSFPISKIKKRNKVVIYYGKIRVSESFKTVYKILKNFDEIIVVTRYRPMSQNDLFLHIAEAKLFISLDPLTNLAYEANLLGTPSYFADDLYQQEYDNFNYPIHGFYYPNNIGIADIRKYNFKVLASKTRSTYRKELSKNILKVKNFLHEYDKYHSLSALRKEKITETHSKNFINFFNNRWSASPIFNCTTFKVIIGYHLFKINAPLFFLIFFVFKTLNTLFLPLNKLFKLFKSFNTLFKSFNTLFKSFNTLLKSLSPRNFISINLRILYLYSLKRDKYKSLYLIKHYDYYKKITPITNIITPITNINRKKSFGLVSNESIKQPKIYNTFYKFLWLITSKFM